MQGETTRSSTTTVTLGSATETEGDVCDHVSTERENDEDAVGTADVAAKKITVTATTMVTA